MIAGEHLMLCSEWKFPEFFPRIRRGRIYRVRVQVPQRLGCFRIPNNQAAAQYIGRKSVWRRLWIYTYDYVRRRVRPPQRSDKMSNGKFVILKIKRQNTPTSSRTGEEFELAWIRHERDFLSDGDAANPVTRDGKATTPITYDSNASKKFAGRAPCSSTAGRAWLARP